MICKPANCVSFNSRRAFLRVLLVVIGVFFIGCAQKETVPEFTSGPTIMKNPNPTVPLAAVINFTASEPVTTSLQILDGAQEWKVRFNEVLQKINRLPVLGLRPDRTYKIRVFIRNASGRQIEKPTILEYTTPPLPTDPGTFPPLRVTVSEEDRMEPGFIMVNPRRRRTPVGQYNQFNQNFGMLLVLDADGEPRWYYRTDSRISDFNRLSNGNLLYVTQDYRIVEIDMLGNEVSSWYATGRPEGPGRGIPVETMTFHHEVDEMPSGNFLTLSTDRRPIENYYTSAYDEDAPRKTQQVMGDRIIEFTRDGDIVWSWNAFEHLDPYRLGYQAFSGYWERRGFPGTVDWGHANALVYVPEDDAVLVNFRLHSAIMKIDRVSGEIQWIFGEHSGWPEDLQDKLLQRKGDMRWPYHQHAPELTPDGTLLLFDNGNFQARPFEKPVPVEETYSRAAEYIIDEENMTVRQVWTSESAEDSDTVVSWAMGDVDYLPRTDNILAGFGLVLPKNRLAEITWQSILRYGSWTRVREYTHTGYPEVLWEVVIGEETEHDIGWTIFGAEKLPSLIP